MKNKKGISIIVLLITIVVMLILLSAVVLSIKDKNITSKSTELKIKTDIGSINDELQNYISHQESEYVRQGLSYSREKLNADDQTATYDNESIAKNINDILPSIKKGNYDGAFKIASGKLVLTGNYNFDEKEEEWINEVLK